MPWQEITFILVVVAFAGAWLSALLSLGVLVYNFLRLFQVPRKDELPSPWRPNPLNAIFFPNLLTAEGLHVRHRVFVAFGWFVGSIAFAFFLGMIAKIAS